MADREVTEPAEGTSPFASSSSADPVDAIAAALRDGDEPPTESATSPPQAARARRLPRMARGTVIGRYVVIDLLGKGGMGDVYAAYDPELDRRIALKLVRDLTGQGRERLIAEAKAMARVSHPNVCAVHDAGRFAEGVFIAMELVDGQTLTAWRRTARGWREILAVFAAAGAGLCAAHAAGIVHRDFKPGNVMIDRDGRVRVLDFGLARVGTPSLPLDPAGPEGDPGSDPEGSPQIVASRVMGTPSYMAPEQRRPGVHDARVDQYAFAVALYEALYGERPFAGDHADEIAVNALAYRVRPPPRERDVPAWLRRPLLKALQPEPADRFASLPALLAELARDPALRRRRVALGAAALGLGALAVVGVTRRPAAAPPCRGVDAPALALWTDAARARVAAAFRATGRPAVDGWTARVADELARRARALGAGRVAACEAASVRHEQSPALLDRRMACLDRRGAELAALIDRLGAAPDAALMDRALDAAARLPPIDACADAGALLSAAPRPTEPARQQELVAAEAALAEVRAATYAADVRHTRALARAGVELAERAGWSVLVAEALIADVDAALAAGDYAGLDDEIFRAARLASEARAEPAVADAWIGAVRALTALGQPREALALARAADAALARLDRPGPQQAELFEAEASALEATGDFAAAMARDDQALALRVADGDDDALQLGYVLTHKAILASRQGDHAAAEALHRRVLAVRTRLLGDAHPDVASSLDNLGAVIYHQGRLDEAAGLYQQALAARRAALGPDHEDVGTSLNNLGGVYLDRGDLAAADDHFTRALATWERALGPAHPSLAIPLGNLGDVALARGDAARALVVCRRAYALEARASGDRSPELAYSLTCEGEALTAAGQPAAALDVLERALALREAAAVDAAELARTRLALAVALAARGLDRPRVARLAVAARDAFTGPTAAARRARADALLGGR
ncbi:MAG: tetratricopeptide repeat protein [Myxococcales bacterium]|nr:tetratricopeptide repeat protein [Myxococcales bacterium]MBP6847018.1 tetratricopeptide repeat protein [Kofleriaceae bacterium]